MEIYIIFILAGSGILAGFLAGLMGIGGGIVTVPILFYALGYYGVDPDVQMHMAVATSLAIIIPTSLFSAKTHYKKDAIDLSLIKSWRPFIIVGAIIGGGLASLFSGVFLKDFFSLMAFIMGLKLITGFEGKGGNKNSLGFIGKGLALLIGGFSSLMGIGGATFSVPVMTIYGFKIHKAVGTASLIGLFISLPAVIIYIYTGFEKEALPLYSLGYISLPAFIFMAPLSSFMAPIGAKVAHSLPKKRLSLFFGAFLILTSLRMAGFLP